MSVQSETAQAQPGLRHEGRLWFGIFAPMLAWAVDEQAGMLLSDWVCKTGNKGVLIGVAAACLALAIAGGVAAYGAFQQVPEEPDDGTRRVPARQRFLSLLGLLASIFFSLALVASAVPGIVHRPCD